MEHRFNTAQQEEVCPDLIIASAMQGHAVVFEWKSGNNIDEQQMRRYATITSDDLTGKARLQVAEARLHDVALVGKVRSRERLRNGIDKAGTDNPLILIDSDGVVIDMGKLSADLLDAALRPRLDVDMSACPSGYVQYGLESDVCEIAEAVVPKIVAAIARKETAITIQDICSQSHGSWGLLGSVGRRALRTRVEQVLSQAAKAELKDVFEVRSGDVIVRDPVLSNDKRERRKNLGLIRRKQAEFLARLRSESAQRSLF
jgi:hypothetical protein